VDKAVLKEKNRLKKMASRQKKATQLAAILDGELRSLCEKMAEITVWKDGRVENTRHSIRPHRQRHQRPLPMRHQAHKTKGCHKLYRREDTGIKAHAISAQTRAQHTTYIPRCTNTVVKVITSTPGDKEQLLHTDFDLKNISNRVFDLDSFHYSAIIALQPETHLLIGERRERVDITKNSMSLFRGDMPHASGAYKKANARLFISLSSPF
jgi:hypothetical protein